MDLKDFVKETISSIVEATAELQVKYEGRGVLVNPPVTTTERDLYRDDDSRHQYRRVEIVSFDVAVTASAESTAGGKAGLRVFSVEASLDGLHGRKSEEVSRVRFAIPLVLSAADVEGRNRKRAEIEAADFKRRIAQRPAGKSWLE